MRNQNRRLTALGRLGIPNFTAFGEIPRREKPLQKRAIVSVLPK
jgi:hypothetical protein